MSATTRGCHAVAWAPAQTERVPFTFFHPAAVVPGLRSRTLVPAGLVIGAMTPDFEYFLRLDLYAVHTHTLPGLVYACVPLGLVGLVLWQGVMREPTVAALPAVLRGRFAGVGSSGVPRTTCTWLLAAVSVLIGAATHLLWDSFTHAGYPPAQWLGLAAPSPIPGYRWTGVLQRTSDVVGFAVLAGVVFRLPKRPAAGLRRAWRFWWLTALVTAAMLALRTWLQPGWPRYGTVIATTISGVLLGLVVAAVVTRWTQPIPRLEPLSR